MDLFLWLCFDVPASTSSFELNRLRMSRVMQVCLNRSLLFYEQQPPVWFNCRQIKTTDTLDPNMCYTTETAPVIHQLLVK